MSDATWICEIDGCSNRTDHSCCLCDTDVCEQHRHFVDVKEDDLNDRKYKRYVCNGCYDVCMIAYANKQGSKRYE